MYVLQAHIPSEGRSTTPKGVEGFRKEGTWVGCRGFPMTSAVGVGNGKGRRSATKGVRREAPREKFFGGIVPEGNGTLKRISRKNFRRRWRGFFLGGITKCYPPEKNSSLLTGELLS